MTRRLLEENQYVVGYDRLEIKDLIDDFYGGKCTEKDVDDAVELIDRHCDWGKVNELIKVALTDASFIPDHIGVAIRRISNILSAGHSHSADKEAWGEPDSRTESFYYAYSHLSYVCACIWAEATDQPTDAETFMPLLYVAPRDELWDGNDWYANVKKFVTVDNFEIKTPPKQKADANEQEPTTDS